MPRSSAEYPPVRQRREGRQNASSGISLAKNQTPCPAFQLPGAATAICLSLKVRANRLKPRPNRFAPSYVVETVYPDSFLAAPSGYTLDGRQVLLVHYNQEVLAVQYIIAAPEYPFSVIWTTDRPSS